MTTPSAKRTALRMIPYGLYILTTQVGEEVNAATVSWFSQISFEPTLVMVALRKKSRIYDMTVQSGHFAINFLGQGQQEVASTFFKHVEATGGTLGGCAYRLGQGGTPVLEDAPAWIECEMVDKVAGSGDHGLVIGQVTAAEVKPDAGPILTLRDTPWSYGG